MMQIEPINPEGIQLEYKPQVPAFDNWLTDTIRHTNAELQQSDQALEKLARGDSDNLHQVMLQLEKAKLSFQLLEQVRSRALTAYQDIMKEQI